MVWCHIISIKYWYRVEKSQALVSRYFEKCSKELGTDSKKDPKPLTSVCFYSDIYNEDLMTHFEDNNVKVLSSRYLDEEKVDDAGKEEFSFGAEFAGFYFRNSSFNIVKSVTSETIVIYRAKSIQYRELCSVLEMVVFRQLQDKCDFLERKLEQCSEEPDEKNIERRIVEGLIGDMIALFNMSNIANIYHPNIPELKLKTIDQKVAQKLFEVDKSIVGVGYRLSTLQIDIVEEQDSFKRDDKERAIKQYLSKAGIKNFEFRKVSPKETLFTLSGYMCCTNGEMAKLGCFAYKVNNEDSKTLCALVACHFAVKSKEVDFKVYMEGDVKLGTVMESTITDKGYDIAAVSVDEEMDQFCERKVRNMKGDRVQGNLHETIESDDEYKKLQNIPVFLWGTSKPGYGKIIIPKYISSSCQLPHVKVMDQDPSCRMAFPKDSGGIICKESLENDEVILIAMLQGSTDDEECVAATPGRKREYVAFLLGHGLQQLEQQTKCQFKLPSAS